MDGLDDNMEIGGWVGGVDERERENVHLIARLDAHARAHLVLPLAGEDLAVDATDLNARIQASAGLFLCGWMGE